MPSELKNKRIVIAGGSGFLGLSMAEAFLRSGADVTILSRSVPGATGAWKHMLWDGRTLPVVDDARSPSSSGRVDGLVASSTTKEPANWLSTIDGCDALVNLAGRTVNCIKTPDHCDEIQRSRIESTRVLGLAMREVASPPPVW